MSLRTRVGLFFGASLLLLAGNPLSAQEWTRFRGAEGDGKGKLSDFPSHITPQNYLWRIELPGKGHSSPVLWGKKLFVTSAEPEKGKRHLLCIDSSTGKTLWKQSFDFQPYSRHDYNSFASSTPAVDSSQVYVTWATPDSVMLYAFDHQGNLKWKQDLGKTVLQHGGANSPIVLEGEGRVLLAVDQEGEEGEGAIFGLDRKTGQIVWKRPRKPSHSAPYSTPLVYMPYPDGVEVVFTSTAHGMTALDPRNGELRWEVPNIFPVRCVSSPILVRGMIVGTCGSGGGAITAVAVNVKGSKRAQVAYTLPRGSAYVPTPITLGEHLYFLGDGGIVTCVQADTGKVLWRERAGGDYFASPITADGKIFLINTKGELVVLAGDGKFSVLDRHEFGEPSHATPAISNETLYVRTESHLIAIGKPRPRK